MSLGIGIVGLPNVGKSTLFKALTRNPVLIANYPFATIEPNTGIVAVPDERLAKLAEQVNPQKIVPATVKFIDIAGLVAGAHKGEGLGNKFLSHIRESDAICLVVRAFADSDITHVDGSVDPDRDIATIKTELVLADLQTVEAARNRLDKLAKGDAKLKAALNTVINIEKALDAGQLLTELELGEIKEAEVANLLKSLLTTKPLIYVFNTDEDSLKNKELVQQLIDSVRPFPAVVLSAKLEAELSELEPAEADELLNEVGIPESGLVQLIHAGYQTLGLETYFTAGEKEVKAWTINKGSKAPQAAGKIHGDFEKGFIAAEVVSYEDLIAAGSWNEAKARGKLRSEGKDYTVADGDVIIFRINL